MRTPSFFVWVQKKVRLKPYLINTKTNVASRGIQIIKTHKTQYII